MSSYYLNRRKKVQITESMNAIIYLNCKSEYEL